MEDNKKEEDKEDKNTNTLSFHWDTYLKLKDKYFTKETINLINKIHKRFKPLVSKYNSDIDPIDITVEIQVDPVVELYSIPKSSESITFLEWMNPNNRFLLGMENKDRIKHIDWTYINDLEGRSWSRRVDINNLFIVLDFIQLNWIK